MHPTLQTSRRTNLRPRPQQTPTANLPLISLTFRLYANKSTGKYKKVYFNLSRLERKYFHIVFVEKQTFNAHFFALIVGVGVVVSFNYQVSNFPSLHRLTLNLFFFLIKNFKIV